MFRLAALLLPCVWAHVTTPAPGAPLALPWQEELARIVCEFASQKQIEEKSTHEVCELIHEKVPQIPQPLCEQALDKAWDAVEAKCGLGPPGKQAPSPADIEKIICDLAGQKEFEDIGVEKACNWINKTFPTVQFQPDCKTVLDKIWDTVEEMCPKHAVALPTPEDIERMACKVATKRQIEERSTEEVCKLIIAKVPAVSEKFCQSVLEKAWDAIVAK
eukprot:CAMPEP_0195133606 /NCGR_PEP_ID=MMETSP0448-20130528/149108_1 /TAXON_ID=66468 /ORGANISM="Heterocapsa triquestra, Strain CCMP 448" /LENGTH=217 /DNA_ID=CAMNT_0040171659 /DNA_START=46 /DNA_END=696 /DNA_ORIENTATION=+